MMKRRLRYAGLIVGIVFVVGAVAFRTAAIPLVVRFPSHLDKTTHYSGTYTSFVDEKTLATLATPTVGKFALDRHLKIVHSTFDTVTIREQLTLHEGTKAPLVQQHEYVMDRRTMQNVKSADSWTFFPSATADRSGAYRLQFPLGISPTGNYPVWSNETGTAVKLSQPSAVHHDAAAGVSVIDFQGSLNAPVTKAYRHWLAANNFPMSLTPKQLQDQLKARGLDVNAALAAVNGKLSPNQALVLANTLGRSVPLNYRYVYKGSVSLEPHTGAIVNVHTRLEGIAVKPDLSGVSAITPMLVEFSSIPAVKAVSVGLQKLINEPPQVAAQFDFTEAPASSLDTGNEAKEQIRMMGLLELWAPWSIGSLGMILVLATTVRRRRSRNVPVDGSLPTPVPEVQVPAPRVPVSVR
jgi:hypothetical protein